MGYRTGNIIKELHICNKDIPALEEFAHAEKSDTKDKAIREFQDIIQRSEEIINHFCYLDLTIEVPNGGIQTLIFIPERYTCKYEELLREYVEKGNMMYFHKEFQSGHLDDSNENTFFIYKIEDSNADTAIEIGNETQPKQIKSIEVNLKWTNTDEFEKSTIQDQVDQWIKIHKQYKSQIRSTSNRPIGWIVVMPIGILDNDDKFKLIGGLYLGVDKECKRINIINFLRTILLPLITNYQRYETKRAYINSSNSAKAAIMSRNMSHNLGSHVMAYLKQSLRSVEDIIEFNALADLIEGNIDSLLKKIQDFERVKANIELPFLVGLGRFISYLQERQDFIATIATDFIPYHATVNFKDFIYDELNPDHRHKRHSDRKGGRPDNILLANIARSEGLRRQPLEQTDGTEQKNDIVIKFRQFNGLNQAGRGSGDLQAMRDYNFSLPGGVVGRQAIFSIVENVIRNAAKHGDWRSTANSSLALTLDIYSKNDESLKRIADDDAYGPSDHAAGDDNLSLKRYLQKYYFETKDIDDLYIVTLTDNLNIDYKVFNKLRSVIEDEDYINDSGEMYQSNKGLKEMRISAEWLRDMEFRQDESDNRARIFRARISKGQHGRNNLQYIFCVPRTKNVAIVADSADWLDEVKHLLNAENRIDWESFKSEDFIALSNKAYNFIISENEEVTGKIRQYAPNKIITAENREQIETWIKQKGEAGLYQQRYEIEDDATIWIADDKVSNPAFERIIAHSGDNGLHSKYIYRSHHESESKLNDFMNSYKDRKFHFVEGISGDNSTDRLVRNDTLDEQWFYKHIHAMKCRVAIFDERLFTRITGIEDNDLIKGAVDETLFAVLASKSTFEDKIAKIDQISANYLSDVINSDLFPQFSEIEHSRDMQRLKEFVANHLTTGISSVDSKNHLPIVYHHKNCHLFNIIYLADTNEFQVWGFTGITDKDGRYRAVYKKVGTVRNDPTQGLLVDIEDTSVRNSFDYITIHQGLLDKIYQKYDWREQDNEKFITTFKLFKQLSKNEGSATDSRSYLPGLIIHSGRSKPSPSDMPQEQPFIQYAAIEHAVLDCKYSLVELLDYARYEPE